MDFRDEDLNHNFFLQFLLVRKEVFPILQSNTIPGKLMAENVGAAPDIDVDRRPDLVA